MSQNSSITNNKNEVLIVNESLKTIETKSDSEINPEKIIQIKYIKFYGFQNIFIVYFIESLIFATSIFPYYVKNPKEKDFYEKKADTIVFLIFYVILISMLTNCFSKCINCIFSLILIILILIFKIIFICFIYEMIYHEFNKTNVMFLFECIYL